MTGTQILDKVKEGQKSGKISLCPRCGKAKMDSILTRNALSRRYDVYICPDCGMEEAMNDFIKVSDGIDDWFIVKLCSVLTDVDARSVRKD